METGEQTTQPANQAARTGPPLDASTKLAIERTRVAYERTMMAWVRTATSLITFGFTIYKFFQLELHGSLVSTYRIGPREFGLTLVSLGLISLILATWENSRYMKALRAEYPDLPYSIATALAALIFALGMGGLIVMILRV
jgi:putative membrane protein